MALESWKPDESMNMMRAGNAVVEYWEGYEPGSRVVSILNELGFRGQAIVSVATVHMANWPEKLSCYWAEKIVAKYKVNTK